MTAGNPGRAAEDLACAYLVSAGLCLLERNYRCRRGEIDLILQETGILVFVEVRYRRQNSHGSAAESVDRRKQSRVTACAAHYLQTRPRAASMICRFDVLAIDGPDNTINWIRNAFTVEE